MSGPLIRAGILVGTAALALAFARESINTLLDYYKPSSKPPGSEQAKFLPPPEKFWNQKPKTYGPLSAAYLQEEDARIAVKLGLARSLGKLDLGEMGLDAIPEAVFQMEELEELSLAGNKLTHLPEGLCRLTSLRRLGLAGNLLTSLPEGIGALTNLEGLWLHGNQLESIPESVGQLVNLRQLSVAGNRLKKLPEALGNLSQLDQLQVSGNEIERLPDSLGGLTSLRLLQANGNKLQEVPQGAAQLPRLEQLLLQGNELRSLPDGAGVWGAKTAALQLINVADNQLESLPAGLATCPRLHTILCYGNRLGALPMPIANGTPALRYLWAEGNPLQGPQLQAFVAALNAREPAVKAVGLDQTQLGAAGLDPTKAPTTIPSFVRPSLTPAGSGTRGYFKLQTADPSGKRASAVVVAFGSAPGEPNWGGLLKQVRAKGTTAAEDDPAPDFDVLYVVDPSRSWYGGGAGPTHEHYRSLLASCTADYPVVLLLGDSMGATAALTFAELATHVLAFCPQVDLTTSAIRPGTGPAQWAVLQQSVLAAVDAAGRSARGTQIAIHVGSWMHDLDQCRIIAPVPHVQLKVYTFDSHRLAYYLQSQGKLAPLVRETLLGGLGVRCIDNVRLTNLL